MVLQFWSGCLRSVPYPTLVACLITAVGCIIYALNIALIIDKGSVIGLHLDQLHTVSTWLLAAGCALNACVAAFAWIATGDCRKKHFSYHLGETRCITCFKEFSEVVIAGLGILMYASLVLAFIAQVVCATVVFIVAVASATCARPIAAKQLFARVMNMAPVPLLRTFNSSSTCPTCKYFGDPSVQAVRVEKIFVQNLLEYCGCSDSTCGGDAHCTDPASQALPLVHEITTAAACNAANLTWHDTNPTGYTRAASEQTRRAALWLWGGVLLVFVGQVLLFGLLGLNLLRVHSQVTGHYFSKHRYEAGGEDHRSSEH